MQKNRFTFHSAFTMLELIFVIVILGIVASLGSQIIVQAYESYLVQRALHRASVKTELVATQIANRLAYAIPNTVIARQSNTVFTAIENAPSKDYDILEWIAYDADSFGAFTDATDIKPGWSGFCDVRASTNSNTQISTPGSSLDLTDTIITKLSGTNSKGLENAGILFPGTYDVNTVGFKGSPTGSPLRVAQIDTGWGTTTIPLAGTATQRTVKEHYKLAWTAYAIVPTELTTAQYDTRELSTTHKLYDLELHHNFQPWDGIYYDNGATKKTTLIRNVSVFNFLGTGDTIRFKLCIQENIGGAYPITMCKEKAVIR